MSIQRKELLSYSDLLRFEEILIAGKAFSSAEYADVLLDMRETTATRREIKAYLRQRINKLQRLRQADRTPLMDLNEILR